MSPKTFLLDELENVSNILNETLRHDYTEQSRGFYDELRRRLKGVSQALKSLPETDYQQLESKSKLISELSFCISLIERSHLGEFSWEFGQLFQALAERICAEPTLGAKLGQETPNRNPIFHISSQGGLSCYKIVRDTELLLENGRNRIFNIVFPRTLKPHVLLHAVLGHELCHAALDIPRHKLFKAKDVLARGTFASQSDAVKWMRLLQPETAEFSSERLRSYATEFLCDIVGLLLMGPSFLSALSSFLGARDPAGAGTEADMPTHPPFLARLAVLHHAMRLRKWPTTFRRPVGSLAPAVTTYHEGLLERLSNIPAIELSPFSDAELASALEAATDALGANTCFEAIDQKPLHLLLENLQERIPPSGSRVTNRGGLDLSHVDFRLIIYAGWIYWASAASTRRVKFIEVNRLCEKGLLHQIAVAKMLEYKSAET